MRSRGFWLLLVVAVGVLAWWLLRDSRPAPATVKDEETDAVGPPEAPTLRGTPPEENEEPAVRRALSYPAGHARIDVEVVDVHGRPLAGVPLALHVQLRAFVSSHESGAAVTLLEAPPKAARPAVARGVSDANGRLSFENLDPVPGYRVKATPDPPYSLAGRDVVASARPGTWVRLVLGTGSPLHLRVVDAEGKGRRGTIELSIVTPENPYLQGWRSGPRGTDGAGLLSLRAAPHGLHEARVTVPGYAERTRVPVRVPAKGEVALRLSFESGAMVFGTVRDAKREPVEGARVLVRCGGYWHENVPSLVRMVTTGADGRYRFTGLPRGQLVGMECVASGFVRPQPFEFRRVLAPEATVQIDIDLQRGSYVRGRVLTVEDEPVPDAYVETTVHSGRGGTAYQLKVKAAEDGTYALGPLPLGRGVATPKARGYHVLGDDASGGRNRPPGQHYDFTEAGGELRADLRMVPGAPVTGRVVDTHGKPVAGATVYLIGPKKLWAAYATVNKVGTDASGAFRFPGLPPVDSFTVRVMSGHARLNAQIERGKANEIVLPASASVAGRVVWPGQPPDVSWFVTVSPAEGRNRRISVLGAEGSFEVNGLPAGRTTLRVLDGFKRTSGTAYDAVLRPGQRVTGVELRPETLLTIEGTVVGEDGRPKAGHEVGMSAADGAARGFTTRTDVEGRFRLGLIPEGTYTVSAEGVSEPATARAGTTGVRLVVDQVKPLLSGTVLLPDGTPLPRGTLRVLMSREANTISWHGTGVSAGSFQYECPPGTESIEVAMGDAFDASGRPVSVRPYSATVSVAKPVTIRLEAARSISGVVVTERGVGVPGVRLMSWATSGRRQPGRTPNLNVVSDSEGRFELVGLEDDVSVHVRVREAPAGFAPPAPVDVGPKETSVRIVLRGGGGTVAGRVEDGEGKPIAGVYVRGKFDDAQVEATSRSDGGFELKGVPLRVRGVVEALPQYGDHPYQPATVEGVEAGQRDVVIRLGMGHVVEGVIGGSSVEGLEIAFFVGAKRKKVAKADASGAFRIGLAETAAGTLVVIDTRNNRYAVLDGVVPPQKGIALSLQAGLSIAGRVEAGKAAEPLVVFAVGGVARAHVSVATDGSFKVSGLPPGRYDLLVLAPRSRGGPRATQKGVEAGATDVRIELTQK